MSIVAEVSSVLKFYYHPLSPVARRVWIALLEKKIVFEPAIVALDKKEQFEPNYLSLNPFHHVPALVHEDVRLIESMAILDYLDRQFPQMALSPAAPADFAKMRMVQMASLNELSSKLIFFIVAENSSAVPEETREHVETCLLFLEQQLNEQDYFGGDRINLADITTGLSVSLLRRLGLSLAAHPSLYRWCARLDARSAWQQTRPSDADFERWRRYIQLQFKRRQKQLAKAA